MSGPEPQRHEPPRPPQTTGDAVSPPARKKRRWARRLLIGFLVLLALLLGLATAAVFRPRWFVSEEWLRDRIVATLRQKTNSDVEIGRIEFYRLGRVKLSDVVIRSVDKPGRPPLMQARNFAVCVKLLPLLRGQVIIKKLVFRDPAFCLDPDYFAKMKFTGAPPNADQIMARLAVEEIEIKNAGLVLLDDGGEPIFSVTQFNMDAKGAQYKPLDYALSLQLAGQGITGVVRSKGTLTAFRDSGHRLDVVELSFQSAPLRASLAGSVVNERQKPALSLTLDTEGDLGTLRQLLHRMSVPLPDDVEITGDSKMRVEFSGPPGDLKAEGVVDIPDNAVRFRGKPLMRWADRDDLTFSVRVQEKRVELADVTIRSSLGRTTITGSVEGEGPNPALNLQVSTQAVLAELPEATGALSASGEMTSSLRVTGHPVDLRVAGDAALDGIEIKSNDNVLKKKGEAAGVALDLAIRDGSVEIAPGTMVRTPLGVVSVTGAVRSPMSAGLLALDVAIEADAEACMSRVPEGRRAGLNVSGKATAKARIEGTPGDLNLTGAMDLGAVEVHSNGKPIRKQGAPAKVEFDVRLTDSEATVNRVCVVTDLASAQVRGKILEVSALCRPNLEFEVTSDLERLTAAAREHAPNLIPKGVKLDGAIRASGTVTGDPKGTCRIATAVQLADCELRHHDVALKPRLYAPETRLDISISKGVVKVDKVSYRSEGIQLSGCGEFRKEGRLALNLESEVDVTQFQPALKGELQWLVSGVNTADWSPRDAELLKSLPGDLSVAGKFSARCAVSADLDDVEASGAVDTAGLGVRYRAIPLKRVGDHSGLDYRFHVEENRLALSGFSLRSDIGRTDVTGTIVSGAKPALDLTLNSDFRIQEWLAGLPIEEILSDKTVAEFLEKHGIDPDTVRHNVRASGAATSRLRVHGAGEDLQAVAVLDLSDVDLHILNEKGKELVRKTAGTHAMVALDGARQGKEFSLTGIRVEHDDDVFSATGKIVLSSGHLSMEDVLLRANDERAKAALDIGFSKDCLTIRHARLEHRGNLWSLAGKIENTGDELRAHDFRIGVNQNKVRLDLQAKGYAEPAPEIRVDIVSPLLDVRPVLPAIRLDPPPKTPHNAPVDTGLQPVPEQMPKQILDFARNAKLDLSFFAGAFLFEVDDRQDLSPGIRRYEMEHVSFKTQLRGGVCHTTAKAILNEGMLDLDWTADFNGDLLQSNVTYWADGVRANDNLRPFMNFTFNNLYIEGEMGFDGSASWSGTDARNVIRTMHGKTRMYIDDGYLLGKAAPEYMIKLFPWLKLGQATWPFKKAHILSVTEGPIATNNMRFRYPGSTYMSGTTNNITRAISYTFGVDLVDSFGLGESTGVVPDAVESRSSIDLCRYVGTINDQKVEWFKLRGDEVVGLMKRLLQVQTFATIFSPHKTVMEKFDYIQGGAMRIITAPARAGRSVLETPGRVIRRADAEGL